jgi:hypothetical protein
MTCSLLGFNAILLTHLFELMFEFAPIVKDNQLRTGMLCQPVAHALIVFLKVLGLSGI